MNTLRLKNYRCFDDTGDISLKPITLLVGANSSGKSSFLKFFPLVKQSVGIKKNGVFLWYSDDVDFKDFKNTVKDGKGNIIIGIEQDIDNRMSESERKYHNKNGIKFNGTTVYIELTISGIDDNTDYLKHLSITFFDQKIDISFSKTNKAKITINDEVFEIDTYVNMQPAGGLLPRIILLNNDGYYGSQFLRDKISDYLNVKNSNANSFAYDILFHSFLFLKKEDFSGIFKKKLKSKTIANINKLNNLYLLYHIDEIIDMCDEGFSSVAINTSYVRPLRVTPERYYRYQNYSVDEIASDGKNLAMYFANLKEDELLEFQQWTLRLFGFELQPHKLEGHVEIEIREKNKDGRNMVDIGFGYNQLLPILAIIWNALNKKQKRYYYSYMHERIKFIVIEQPELHLHPRILSMFADMLSSVINDPNIKQNGSVRFIIETHSETLVNKIGSLIQSSKLDKNNVNVVLFNAQNEGLNNYVEQTDYDSKGYLQNWPIGFFS